MRTALLILYFALFGWAESALACRIVNPKELLFNPQQKGPFFTDIASKAEQFAGRTTLNSGSASVVVSTVNVRSNSLIFPVVQVALPAAYVVRGQAALNSGDNSVTASSSAIYSGMNIMLTLEGLTSQLSGYPRGLRVNSIVNGVSFLIATVDSLQVQGVTANVAQWAIPEAVPQGIKVNTISDSGYFTLGWADGRARPVDTTIMWECKLPGRTTA